MSAAAPGAAGAAAGVLIPCRATGWRMGLANTLGKEELAAWWRTRLGWVQCLVARLLLNGDQAVNLRWATKGRTPVLLPMRCSGRRKPARSAWFKAKTRMASSRQSSAPYSRPSGPRMGRTWRVIRRLHNRPITSCVL